jgi:hypothetical protein
MVSPGAVRIALMIEPSDRVCPRCGEAAGEPDLCATCSANLAAMRGMLPTRAEWEAASSRQAVPDDRHTKRRSRWAAGGARSQVIVSLGVVALFVVVLIAGQGSTRPHSRRATRSTLSVPGTATTPPVTTAPPVTTTPAVMATRAVARSPRNVAACVAAWNGGSSAQHHQYLARTVGYAHTPVAVIATYHGPDRTVTAVGGNPVLVKAGRCVLAADNFVFMQQPDGSWGLTQATLTSFSSIARDSTWTVGHANATVNLAPPATAAGTVRPSKGSLLVLTASDVGG